MGKFEQQINKFARKYESRFRAIGQTAVQETASMAQRVGISEAMKNKATSLGVTVQAGGRMRVDTGFLRASIQAGLHQMPRGPNQNEGTHGGKRKYPLNSQVTGENISTVLLRWDPNKNIPLFVGWTASYARYRESKDGFLRGAVEKWDQTVFKAVKRVEAGVG
jgi:hypothetical protein